MSISVLAAALRIWPHKGFRTQLRRTSDGERGSAEGGFREMWQRPGSRALQQTEGNARMIKRFLAVVMSFAMFGVLAPVADAQSSCPAEVAQARDMFSKVAKAQDVQAPRSLAGARGQDTQAPRSQDVQAPRSLAGARGQDTQAPRSQDVQAPRSLAGARGQDTQAPRGQDTQAPRGQDTQAPRGQDTQAPHG